MILGTTLTVYRSNWDSFLEKCAVNVQHNGNRKLVVSDFDLGQLKGYRSVRITSKESVTMGILILVKCKVLVTGQTQITNQFAQHLFYWPREKLQNLWSVTILVHVDNLQITAVYGSLKALQHVSVNVVCIEFRIFQDIF